MLSLLDVLRRVTDGSEPPYECHELNPGPVQGQQAILTDEAALWPQIEILDFFTTVLKYPRKSNLRKEGLVYVLWMSSIDEEGMG